MIGQVYEAFVQGTYMEVLPSYIGLPLFLIVWLGFHLVKRDRVVALDDMDVKGVRVDDMSRRRRQ